MLRDVLDPATTMAMAAGQARDAVADAHTALRDATDNQSWAVRAAHSADPDSIAYVLCGEVATAAADARRHTRKAMAAASRAKSACSLEEAVRHRDAAIDECEAVIDCQIASDRRTASLATAIGYNGGA